MDIESPTDVEKRIKSLLREYRTLPAKIKLYERLSRGIGLVHEPRITAAPPTPDYQHLIAHVAPLSKAQQSIADTVRTYVSDSLGSRMSGRRTGPSQYITAARVAEQLRGMSSEDPEEDGRLMGALQILDRGHSEERVELSDTERIVIQRESEIQRAKTVLDVLRDKYEAITYALGVMQEYYDNLYQLLKCRYIDGSGWLDVCDEMSINGVAMTRKEYLNRRKEAMAEFAKWCPLANEETP